MKNPLFLRAISLPLLLHFALSSCDSSSNDTRDSAEESSLHGLPEHARYVHEDAWAIITLRPEQFLQKMAYRQFIRSPLFSQMGKEARTVFEILDLEDPEKTGIHLSQPVFIFMRGDPDGQDFQLEASFAISDASAFRNFVDNAIALMELQDMEGISQSTDGGTHVIQFEAGLLSFDKGKALVQAGPGRIVNRFDSPGDVGKLSPKLRQHLMASFDLAYVVNFPKFLNIMPRRGPEAEMLRMFESLGMELAGYEISGEKGSLVLRSFNDFVDDDVDYDIFGKGVDGALLSVIPENSIAGASLSLNLQTILSKWLPIFANMTGDPSFPRNGDEVIPDLELSFNDLAGAFTGQVAGAFVNMPAPGVRNEVPEFVIAVQTADPNSNTYRRVIANRLLPLWKEHLSKEAKADGVELRTVGDLIIIASSGQLPTLGNGSAYNPVSGEKRAILKNGFGGVWFDPNRLLRAMPIDRGTLNSEQASLLRFAEGIDLVSMKTERKDEKFSATMEISFRDKSLNGWSHVTRMIERIGAF